MHQRKRTSLSRDEDGAAYTLSYVMIMPLIIMICCLVCETCLILMAKMGTVYASFVGARTAVVRYSANERSVAEGHISDAAIQAFTPFASGMNGARGGGPSDSRGKAYVDAFGRQYPNARVSHKYLQEKYRYAASALVVEPSGPPASWEDDVGVTVTYSYPYAFGLIGRLMGGERSGSLYIRKISTTTKLQSESPRNEEQLLGISYASP